MEERRSAEKCATTWGLFSDGERRIGRPRIATNRYHDLLIRAREAMVLEDGSCAVDLEEEEE